MLGFPTGIKLYLKSLLNQFLKATMLYGGIRGWTGCTWSELKEKRVIRCCSMDILSCPLMEDWGLEDYYN